MKRREDAAAGKLEAARPAATAARKQEGATVRELEKRLAEALEQQAATSEILRVISRSPSDVQPVLDTIAAAALKLCHASATTVATFDGKLVRMAAMANISPEGAEALRRQFPRPVSRESAVTRAILTRSVVMIPDVLEDDDYGIQSAALASGFRSALGVPLMREGNPIGAIAVGRLEPGAFPDTQVALLQTFADQAIIAIENARLFKELDARNRDLTEALEQQTATSEILGVISSSPTDVQPVFDAIVQSGTRLCAAAFAAAFRYDGQEMTFVAHHNMTSAEVELMRPLFPRPAQTNTATGRAVVQRRVIHIPDIREDSDYGIQSLQQTLGFRTVLAVPILRNGEPIGAFGLWRRIVEPFTDKQVELIKGFADQAVIAIENVRLFNELEARNRDLTQALERQTATSEILRVISQSPRDVQPVFDTIAAAALKLCSASSANVFTFDGALVHLAALVNLTPEGADVVRSLWPRPPSRDTAATRAILTSSVVAIPDVISDPDFAATAAAVAGNFRSILSVPLMRDGRPIGAIAVGRPEAGPFPDSQIALLRTFADQAVIAIENVRLFNELEGRNRDLTEALEQQTATSEILRAISQSPTDTQPVFDIIGERAEKLCDAEISLVSIVDGDLIKLVALHGENPEGTAVIRRFFPVPLTAETITARAIRRCSVVHVADVMADPDYEAKDVAREGGFRGSLGVPMLREGRVIGAIFVSRRTPGLYTDSQVELLKTFADQAVIAIENVRLFTELGARTRELTRLVSELKALGEVGRAVSSTLDLETVLSTIVSRATELAGMDGGSIWEYDEAREEFHLHATNRLPDELVEVLRATPIRKGEGALGRLAVTGEPVEIPDIADEQSYQSRLRETLVRCGYRSVLTVPLLREDRLLGALAVNRKSAGDFAPQVVELLKTFATQSALAIQNARLFREIEVKSRELEVASRHKSEFLANMSHELRTPLNAIIGFSEVLSERMFGEINEKQAEYLGDILESGRHLLSLINDILDLSKIEAGRMELEPAEFDLPNVIENTLILVRERAARRGVALGQAVDERLGTIRADERKVKQVLLNLLSNALKFTPEGGNIDVRAAIRDGVAEISVKDSGVGIAAEDQEAVFEEFRQVGTASRKVEGTGLGLAISRRFVELHGGRIWVESAPGAGTTFTFTLPLR